MTKANIVFYGKPTCINNRKQRKILHDAGVEFKEENLLDFPWTKEILIPFFANTPQSQWLNKTAPAIKQGTVRPDTLTQEQLLEAMCNDPVLIRRPLITINEQHFVGFDWPTLANVLGIDPLLAIQLLKPEDDVETCVKVQAS